MMSPVRSSPSRCKNQLAAPSPDATTSDAGDYCYGVTCEIPKNARATRREAHHEN